MSSKKKPNNRSKYLALFAIVLIGILGCVTYFKQTDLDIIWKHKANYFLMDALPNGIAPISTEKLISTNSAIILVEDKKISSVNPETGKEKWEYVEPENQFTYEDKISFENGEVKVLNNVNVLEFNKKERGNASSEIIDLTNEEVTNDGKVYKTGGLNLPPFLTIFFMDNTDKYINIYEVDSGKKLWSWKKPIKQAIYKDGVVYFTSDGWVYAVK